jgi:hypothetical protein
MEKVMWYIAKPIRVRASRITRVTSIPDTENVAVDVLDLELWGEIRKSRVAGAVRPDIGDYYIHETEQVMAKHVFEAHYQEHRDETANVSQEPVKSPSPD